MLTLVMIIIYHIFFKLSFFIFRKHYRSDGGYSFEVGKIVKNLLIFKDLFIYKIAYNNSKYRKAYLVVTQDNNGYLLAQNKYFNF